MRGFGSAGVGLSRIAARRPRVRWSTAVGLAAPWLSLLSIIALSLVALPLGSSIALAEGGTDNPLLAWLRAWPEASRALPTAPLLFDVKTPGYRSQAGRDWVARLGRWYREGTAAGLGQDGFRSYCGGHSSLQAALYPQLRLLPPLDERDGKGALATPEESVYRDRVTFGVRSQGVESPQLFPDGLLSTVEMAARASLRRHYDGEPGDDVQRVIAGYPAHNFIFAVPGLSASEHGRDRFTFLGPSVLHATGASGTDTALLKPLVFASAALQPRLKTRIVRSGMLAPTLIGLWKQHLMGGLRSESAHRPVFDLPDEADDSWSGPTPRLAALLEAAHALSHIPPAARITVSYLRIDNEEAPYPTAPYVATNDTSVAIALRPGERLTLELDLRGSFVEGGVPRSYTSKLVRGPGRLARVDIAGSQVRLEVEWNLNPRERELRTDVALVVNDGSYDSAPAYVSIKHIQPFEAESLGVRLSEN